MQISTNQSRALPAGYDFSQSESSLAYGARFQPIRVEHCLQGEISANQSRALPIGKNSANQSRALPTGQNFSQSESNFAYGARSQPIRVEGFIMGQDFSQSVLSIAYRKISANQSRSLPTGKISANQSQALTTWQDFSQS